MDEKQEIILKDLLEIHASLNLLFGDLIHEDYRWMGRHLHHLELVLINAKNHLEG